MQKKNWRKKYKNADHLAEFALGPGISASIEQSFYSIDKKYYSLSLKAHWIWQFQLYESWNPTLKNIAGNLWKKFK